MKRFIYFLIVLIFLFITSWSLANFYVDYKYNEASQINDDMNLLISKAKYDDNLTREMIITDLEKIDAKVRFLNSICVD